LFPKKTNVSMPHGKTQLMFMCPSLNEAFIEAPPSTNLQQDTQYPHGVAWIIDVSTLIQRVDILGYAQCGGTIIRD
jgi:hypothetical protein